MYIDIKSKMKEKGLNRSQLAKLVQIGYPAINAIYDSKTTRISFDVLEALCRVLECTPNDILIFETEETIKHTKNILSQHGIDLDGSKESEQSLDEIVEKLTAYIKNAKK